MATVTATPEPVEREVRLLRLKDRNAKELIELAKHLFDNEVSPDGTKPQIIADSVGSRLVVIATEEEFKRVEQFALDYNSGRQDLGPHQFKFVDVPVGQADEVVKAVSKLYQDQLRDNPDRQANAATILADSENDRVIISGPQKEVGRAEGLVRMLGPSKGSGGGQKVTEVVQLKAANAQTVSGLIEKSFNAGGNRNKINLLVDEPSNSLVLTGAEKSVAAAGSVIRELDSGNREKPMELRILELRAAEVTKVAPLVTELFTALMKDRHGENYLPKSKIISDEAANRLIITGQLDEIEEIDKLVKQLDSTTRQSAGNRIFKIRAGDAKKISRCHKQDLCDDRFSGQNPTAPKCCGRRNQQPADCSRNSRGYSGSWHASRATGCGKPPCTQGPKGDRVAARRRGETCTISRSCLGVSDAQCRG